MNDYDNSPMRELIKEKIHKLRDRQVLFDRLCNELSYAEIEAKYNISKATVGRIIQKGKKRLFLS